MQIRVLFLERVIHFEVIGLVFLYSLKINVEGNRKKTQSKHLFYLQTLKALLANINSSLLSVFKLIEIAL